MKRFFRTLAFLAVAAVATVSISSCKEEDDDNKKTNQNEQMSGAKPDAFFKGLTNPNNVKSTILIDTREAAKYNKAHIVYKQDGETIIEAISMPLEDEIFYVSGSDHQFYKDVEKLDPNHENFILVTDEGASSLTLKVTGVLSGMGWGKEKIYLLACSTEEFLKQYPDLDSSK